VRYKEKFDKEMKGKKPQFDLKESKIYKTLKDANDLASEVKYKGDLKKIHKPVTDMAESLSMQHSLSTSKLSSDYRYKKKFEESKGHYHMIPDTPEQLHLKEASELQSNVKYKEKYEKEKGKPMLDFETPTYVCAKEAQHMQSQKEYRKDLEEGVKGKGLTVLEETPELLRAKNATQILCEREYKKSLEQEIKGKGMLALATDTPDFMRARNATEILSQTKYKQIAEMDRASYTTVIDTPDIIHAQQMRNIVSQVLYSDSFRRQVQGKAAFVLDTPEMRRVRETQRIISGVKYHEDFEKSKGSFTPTTSDPVTERVKKNMQDFSDISYRGIQRRVVEMERRRAMEHDQETITGFLFWLSLSSKEGSSLLIVKLQNQALLKHRLFVYFRKPCAPWLDVRHRAAHRQDRHAARQLRGSNLKTEPAHRPSRVGETHPQGKLTGLPAITTVALCNL
ncbi:hypothetical protein GOODEAATRI_003895, partial [Goodea atripinnis]